MKLRIDSFEVNPENPYENDVLGRAEAANNLGELLKSLDVPFVLSISSPWGTGKTTFVQMLRAQLKLDGVHALYYNAWVSDFTDPLIGFMSEIQEQIIDEIGDKEDKAKEHFEKAKKIGISVARRALPAIAKLLTAGALDLKEVNEELLAGIAEALTSASLEEFKSAKNAISEFQSQLEEFANKVKDINGYPIIVFVDELDRCRPSYSIALLERIKHLFNVNGIVFVLVLDREELSNVIRSQYGINDTAGYLSKFIDLEYLLPRASIEQYAILVTNRLGTKKFFAKRRDGGHEFQSLFDSIVAMSGIFGFSLRTLERCLTQVTVILHTIPPTKLLYPNFVGFLVALKIAKPKEYKTFTSGTKRGEWLIELVRNLPGGEEFFTSRKSVHIEAHLITSFLQYDQLARILEKYGTLAENPDLNREERERGEWLVRVLKDFINRDRVKTTQYLVSKIEMAESFVSPDNWITE